MDQHTVPRFYLEGFTDPETPEGQEPFCWIRSAGADWRRRAPVNLTKIPDYYDGVNPDGSPDRSLEKDLEAIETTVAPTIAGLKKGSELSVEDRHRIALFAATMRGRTVGLHEVLEHHHREVEELARRQRTSLGLPPGEGLGLASLKKGSIQRASVDGAVQASFGVFVRMGWNLVEASPPDYFITSDNPVSVCDPHAPSLGSRNLLSPMVEVVFPLRRDIALFASWVTTQTRWKTATPEQVRLFNVRTRQDSVRLVVAPKRDLPGSRSEEVSS